MATEKKDLQMEIYMLDFIEKESLKEKASIPGMMEVSIKEILKGESDVDRGGSKRKMEIFMKVI